MDKLIAQCKYDLPGGESIHIQVLGAEHQCGEIYMLKDNLCHAACGSKTMVVGRLCFMKSQAVNDGRQRPGHALSVTNLRNTLSVDNAAHEDKH
jgi:hypothetical protein